jgi:hypothetical protein
VIDVGVALVYARLLGRTLMVDRIGGAGGDDEDGECVKLMTESHVRQRMAMLVIQQSVATAARQGAWVCVWPGR